MDKKSSYSFTADWAEFFFMVLLLIGIVIGVLAPSAIITYLIALASGMIAGRVMYDKKVKEKAPYVLIIIGFVFGFVIGTFRGDRRITFLLFLFGAILLYYLFDKKIIKDVFI